MALKPLCLLALAQGAAAHGWVTTPVARNMLICDSRGESEYGCKADRETHPPHPGDQPGPVGGNICAGDNNNGISSDAKQQMMVPGPIQGKYTAGEVVEMTWHVYADHGGWYSYRICMDGSDTEECFQKHVLSNTDGQQKNTVTHGSRSDYSAQIKIPDDLSCDRCTLSWFWHGDPSYEDNIFVNCIDISISGGGPSPSPPPTPSPVPPPSPPSPAPPSPTPPTPPTPTPSPPQPAQTCQVTEGYDCKGGDISQQHVGSQGECCSLCQKTSGCNAFTYAQYDWTGAHTAACYLKTDCATKSADATCTAGTLDPQPSAGCPFDTIESCLQHCPRESAAFQTCGRNCESKCSHTHTSSRVGVLV